MSWIQSLRRHESSESILFSSLLCVVCWAAKVWSRHINYSGVSRQRGRVRACVPVSVLLICCNCCNCQMSRCGHCHCCPASGPTLRTTLPLHTALWVLTCTIIKCNTCFWWSYVLIAIYPDADTACCRLHTYPQHFLKFLTWPLTVVYYKVNYLPVGVRIWFWPNCRIRVFGDMANFSSEIG